MGAGGAKETVLRGNADHVFLQRIDLCDVFRAGFVQGENGDSTGVDKILEAGAVADGLQREAVHIGEDGIIPHAARGDDFADIRMDRKEPFRAAELGIERCPVEGDRYAETDAGIRNVLPPSEIEKYEEISQEHLAP